MTPTCKDSGNNYLDLQNGQNNGPYTAYTLHSGIMGHYPGLFWRSRDLKRRPQTRTTDTTLWRLTLDLSDVAGWLDFSLTLKRRPPGSSEFHQGWLLKNTSTKKVLSIGLGYMAKAAVQCSHLIVALVCVSVHKYLDPAVEFVACCSGLPRWLSAK